MSVEFSNKEVITDFGERLPRVIRSGSQIAVGCGSDCEERKSDLCVKENQDTEQQKEEWKVIPVCVLSGIFIA